MTREQIKAQFPDATDEQITALLDINGADVNKWKDKVPEKKAYDELVRKAGEYDKLSEANLTDAEKVQKALDEANIAKADYAKKANRLDAEKIFVNAGITEEEYKDLIDNIVSEDAEKTKALATSMAALVGNQKEAAIKKTKEELMDNTPTPGGKGKEDEKTDAEKIAENLGKASTGTKATESVLENYL